MEFPEHVLEVKKALKESNDVRLDTMKELTEPKDKDDRTEVIRYIKMWEGVFKEEKKYTQEMDNRWVYSFLGAVIEACNLPKHAYLSAIDRKDLISSILYHTKELKNKYEAYGFNVSLITNDGQFFHGFSSYDVTEEDDIKIIDKGKPSKASVNETLDYFAERAEEEIDEYSYKGKKGKNIEAVRFIRILAKRNKNLYGRTLNSVLKIAVFAIYGLDYSDSDITNIIKRKTDKGNGQQLPKYVC